VLLCALVVIILPQEMLASANYVTSNNQFYSLIMGQFQNILNTFIDEIVPALFQLFKVKEITNFLGVFVITMFAIKKVQEGDFITFKNMASILLFMLFLAQDTLRGFASFNFNKIL